MGQGQAQEEMNFDILIIGAGPAGLSAAIRLAQLSKDDPAPLSICVLEKGAEVGSHLLSGAVLELKALLELLPNWQSLDAPLSTPVTEDVFYYLSSNQAFSLPIPLLMKNKGNEIISIDNFCRWLAKQAEELNTTIFTGFAGSALLYEGEKVIGVQTGCKGEDKGVRLLAKQTLLAEGCRGSLTKQLIHKHKLDKGKGRSPQTYGIGIKELWEIPAKHHQLGRVVHTVGWPLDSHTYGGGFIYHSANQQLAVGFIMGLDYTNPYLDPFEEFQRFKTHPSHSHLFENGRRTCYGARALSEGGWQSLPTLTVPGAMIIGDSAGTLNVPKIKGTHTAMKSGMLAAETIYQNRNNLEKNLTEFETILKKSWVGKELYRARNVRPSFKRGLWGGLLYTAFDLYLLHGRAPWTFNNLCDHLTLKLAKNCKPIAYPKPDNKVTFDKLSSVYLANTHYNEPQPCHLQIKDSKIPIEINLKKYDFPEGRYCPANVYEIVYLENTPQLQINASNCVHCKTCDIKDPMQNINWVPPEGGDGPNYVDM